MPFVGYPLLAITLLFTVFGRLTDAEVSFAIASISGISAIISFVLRIFRDWNGYKDDKQRRKASGGKDSKHEDLVAKHK